MDLENRDIPWMFYRGIKFLCRTVVYGFLALMVLLVLMLMMLSVILGVTNLLDTLFRLVIG